MTAYLHEGEEDSLAIEESLAILRESIPENKDDKGLVSPSEINSSKKEPSVIYSIEIKSDDYLPFCLSLFVTCRVLLVKKLPPYNTIPNRDESLLPPILNQKRLTLVAIQCAFHL